VIEIILLGVEIRLFWMKIWALEPGIFLLDG
jgi:hypothetical protein